MSSSADPPVCLPIGVDILPLPAHKPPMATENQNINILIPAWVEGALTPVEKLAVHQRGLRHLAVSVFVMRAGKILIQRRALSKYHTPGLWANTCCTHPNWDEPPLACGMRRLNEELGITGLSLHHRGQVTYHADVGGGLVEHEVVEVFTATAPDDLDITPNPDEVMDIAWIDPAALRAELDANPQAYTPWLRIYMERHAQMILGDLAES